MNGEFGGGLAAKYLFDFHEEKKNGEFKILNVITRGSMKK